MTTLLARTEHSTRLADRLACRLAAIDALSRARREAQAAVAPAAASREQRMDAARAVELLERQHAALVARCDDHLRQADGPSSGSARRTALVGHRQPWFVDKVRGLLQDRGVAVVGDTEVGAELVGWAAAEQPDLVLLEDRLAMQPGRSVVRDVRRFCDGTTVAAVVPYTDDVGAMLDAGAHCVHVRAVPPAQVVDEALAQVELLLGRASGGAPGRRT